MSLIKCVECGKKFSDKAKACPKCSCPITEIQKNLKEKELKKTNKNKLKEKKISFINKFKNEIEDIKKNKKKRNIIIIIFAVLIVGIFLPLNFTIFNKDWREANTNFKIAYNIVKERNKSLDELIEKSEKLVNSSSNALDEELRTTLENSISIAKSVKQDLPNKSLFIKEINKKTKELNKINYETEYNTLKQDYNNLDISIKKYQLVNHPTETYVIDRLKTVKHVKGISAVTEDNDPNGKLNKPGGYTATVYYSDERIKLDKDIYGKTIIEQGTDGGGAIEVYATVEDAIKRRDYLSAFDGGVLSNGSHTIIGTVLVRTSDELTATQQKEMEKMIIDALTYIDSSDDIVIEENDDDTQDTDNKKEDTNNTQNSNNSSKPNNSSTSNNNTSKKSIEQVAKEIYNNKNKAIGRTDLISILVNEKKYSESEAKSVVEKCCDWNSSALILANNQSSSGYMYPKLITDNLKSKSFTTDEINYAIKKCEHNWNELVVSHAKTLSSKYFSKKEITSQLNNLGFSSEQQNYAIDNSNINWNTMASKYAEHYYYNKGYIFSYCKEHGGYIGDNNCPKCGVSTEGARYFSCSKTECVSQFVSVGFTENQAKNALNSYDDNLFVASGNKKKHLAYYTLGRLLVYINPKPTRDECTNKLSNWGFSNDEIQYAHSKYADYHFSK